MSEKTIKVELRGDLSHAGVAQARTQILDALGKAGEVGIDLGGVSRFDATLPQLLISAQASAAAAGKRISFPGLINTDLARMAFDLGFARPDGVGDEWPW